MNRTRVTLLFATLLVTSLVSLLAAPPVVAKDAKCSLDAMLVGQTCVDIFEATLWGIPPDQTGLIKNVRNGKATFADLTAGGATQHGCTAAPFGHTAIPGTFPVTGNWTVAHYAASIPGVLPSACVSFFQAEQACALSGKRLLTNQEWQRAVAGTVDPGSNDAVTLGNTMCHTGGTVPRNTGLAGATPGGADSCISNWSVQDMVGNVHEWVGDWGDLASSGCTNWSATFGDDSSCVGDGTATGATLPGALYRGGRWSSGTNAGVFAVAGDGSPSFAGEANGFRCGR